MSVELTKQFKLEALNNVCTVMKRQLEFVDSGAQSYYIGIGMCVLIQMEYPIYSKKESDRRINYSVREWFNALRPDPDDYPDYDLMRSKDEPYWFHTSKYGDRERVRYIELLIEKVKNDEI